MNQDEIFDRVCRAGVKPAQIQGCTESEIRRIQAIAPSPLPKVYLDFLSQMGVRAGRYMKDVDIFFPAPLSLKRNLSSLRELSGLPLLDDDVFVFAGRQGEQFAFFRLGFRENPPVYFSYEWDPQERCVHRTFTDFLEEELKLIEMNPLPPS